MSTTAQCELLVTGDGGIGVVVEPNLLLMGMSVDAIIRACRR